MYYLSEIISNKHLIIKYLLLNLRIYFSRENYRVTTYDRALQ